MPIIFLCVINTIYYKLILKSKTFNALIFFYYQEALAPNGLRGVRPRRQSGRSADDLHGGQDPDLHHRPPQQERGHRRSRISGDEDDSRESQILRFGGPHQGDAGSGLSS